MAHATTSMAGLHGSSQAVLEGSLHISGSSHLIGLATTTSHFNASQLGLNVRAQRVSAETSRRAVLGVVAVGLASGSFVKAVFAEAKPKPIPIGPPPPPSGGLPGTLNSDQARDGSLDYRKDRFYLQPLSPADAAQRAKESAKDIINIKNLIDKKAWPYVQNDLRLRAEYLRYDLKTAISAKPKDEKKSLEDLTGKLFDNINNLDHAAKIKSTSVAEKYYAQTVSTLNDVLAKLG